MPATEVDKQVDADLQKRGRTANLKGFRPGKVPLKVLRGYFGGEARKRVLIDMAGQRFQGEMENAQERLAASPNIVPTATVAVDGEYHVSCHYEVLPDIEKADFSGRKLKVPNFQVGDAEVEEMIEILRERRGNYIDSKQAAAEGDLLTIDYKAYLEGENDGEPIDAKEGRRFKLETPSLAPDMDAALRGVVVGDRREVKTTHPDDHPDERFRGKTLRTEVAVVAVQTLEKAALNDAFYSDMGVADGGLDAFKQMVKEHLSRESEVRLRNLLHQRAMSVLIDATPVFAAPQSLLYNETVGLWRQAQQQQKQMGMESVAHSIQPEMFFAEAQRRVVLGLIMAEWQRREQPQVGEAEVEARVADVAAAYEEPEQKKAQIRADARQMESVRLSVLEDKVVEWVRSHAENEEETLTLRQLLSDGDKRA